MRWGVEEMAQLVKCLPHKHEELTLIPRTHTEKPCGTVPPAIPVLGKWRRQDSWDLPATQSISVSELQIQPDSPSQKVGSE